MMLNLPSTQIGRETNSGNYVVILLVNFPIRFSNCLTIPLITRQQELVCLTVYRERKYMIVLKNLYISTLVVNFAQISGGESQAVNSSIWS